MCTPHPGVVSFFLHQMLASLGMLTMMPPLLEDALGRFIFERSLQNHVHSITLEENVLKTCPDMSNVVLGVENDHFRDHQSQGFLFSRPDYFMIYCEQVADFSELRTQGVYRMEELTVRLLEDI